jgi:hypothetical protein
MLKNQHPSSFRIHIQSALQIPRMESRRSASEELFGISTSSTAWLLLFFGAFV